jgi:hypothetical protein
MPPDSILDIHLFDAIGASYKFNCSITLANTPCAVQQNNQVGMITLMS